MKHIRNVSLSKASMEDITAAVQECIQSVLDAAGLGAITSLIKKEEDAEE